MKKILYLTTINLYLTTINKNNNIKIEILNFQMMHQFYLLFPPTPPPFSVPAPGKKKRGVNLFVNRADHVVYKMDAW